MLLAIIGVALIASPEFSHNQRALWGFASGILSGAALALAMSCVRKVQDYGNTALLPLMCLFNLFAMLTALPFALLSDAPFMPQTGNSWFWVAVYGIVMQCGAWGLVIYAIRRLSLALTGLILLSEPVAAIMIDAVWLDKAIVPLQWLGCAITLIAIYLGSLRRHA